MSTNYIHPDYPSQWVVRWTHLLKHSSSVLDVACGAGRHCAWFESQGHQVTGIDRDPGVAQQVQKHAKYVLADIENKPWPLMKGGKVQTFDAVVVTHYLWRPLLPTILESLAEDAVLIYETFALGHERFGRPSRPEFLLRPGELLSICTDMHVVAYEDGITSEPGRKRIQRIAAVKRKGECPPQEEDARYWERYTL